MILQISDWKFQVDLDATFEHTSKNSQDHCECSYCQNFYSCADIVYPELRSFLSQFGVVLEGPSELMPFEPTLMLVCYRVSGYVVEWGRSPIYVNTIPVVVQEEKDDTFLLWIGEMQFPWCMEEKMEDVISPANTPEFMERMQQVWFLRHDEEYVFS